MSWGVFQYPNWIVVKWLVPSWAVVLWAVVLWLQFVTVASGMTHVGLAFGSYVDAG